MQCAQRHAYGVRCATARGSALFVSYKTLRAVIKREERVRLVLEEEAKYKEQRIQRALQAMHAYAQSEELVRVHKMQAPALRAPRYDLNPPF